MPVLWVETMAALPACVAEEDGLRAGFYGLLAGILGRRPDAALLSRLQSLGGDPSDLGCAMGDLAARAGAVGCDQAQDEFDRLFVGMTRGELVPYGSFYMTGFLHEKPLALLRDDMARLGIAAAPGVSDPEDHIAFLCEMMQGLIGGAFGQPADLAMQRRFFDTHLAPWASRFFGDLEQCPVAQLYRPVGTMGRLFMEIEAEAFRMLD